jgi:hypothetical protein
MQDLSKPNSAKQTTVFAVDQDERTVSESHNGSLSTMPAEIQPDGGIHLSKDDTGVDAHTEFSLKLNSSRVVALRSSMER